ncbi:JM85 [macacine gammaherpesvirus 11]|uniref:JM85 n=2 Tax=macacine gammaherpesvirus 11 TaxID=2560570 RepID=G9JM93_9GAMA|nr:JM85 [Macaca fuscata rhadinovirus]AAT00062.1 JM85 [Macaca fuscata rhadinovirus]AEW87610.1 JM85 [Macaca fuscata rhadinovirus]AEW87780.1 JM85 [Macaca fuscata rhadinovirus]
MSSLSELLEGESIAGGDCRPYRSCRIAANMSSSFFGPDAFAVTSVELSIKSNKPCSRTRIAGGPGNGGFTVAAPRPSPFDLLSATSSRGCFLLAGTVAAVSAKGGEPAAMRDSGVLAILTGLCPEPDGDVKSIIGILTSGAYTRPPMWTFFTGAFPDCATVSILLVGTWGGISGCGAHTGFPQSTPADASTCRDVPATGEHAICGPGAADVEPASVAAKIGVCA